MQLRGGWNGQEWFHRITNETIAWLEQTDLIQKWRADNTTEETRSGATTLEATQRQILSQSPTDATRFPWVTSRVGYVQSVAFLLLSLSLSPSLHLSLISHFPAPCLISHVTPSPHLSERGCPVHLIITMIQWMRTSRLSIRSSLSLRGGRPLIQMDTLILMAKRFQDKDAEGNLGTSHSSVEIVLLQKPQARKTEK